VEVQSRLLKTEADQSRVPTQGRALLVDDEPNILRTLSLILKSEGFEVQTAESADSAKQYLSKFRFDLLITDLSLEQPHSGFELVRIANLQPDKPASVVISGFHDLLAHWQEFGADAGMQKPTDLPELLATISRLLSNRAKENREDAA